MKQIEELIAKMWCEWTYGGGTSYVGTQNTEDPACLHSPNCQKCRLKAALTATPGINEELRLLKELSVCPTHHKHKRFCVDCATEYFT